MAVVNAVPVGDGVDTPAVTPAGSAVADTFGCNWIAAPLSMSTGARNADAVAGWMLNVAVYWVPVTAEVLAESVTMKS
ncbi:hypothetical protein GCM10010116_11990 [Microbispora rosea subsp. aerata]|nr:hypothetical protein GCM10010116_11990 [Microbispora rosea subsp. aerata]GIH55193.1 hypothetical protein Mro02_21070 [Microbispora rosea subsp. aerata]GLJ82643.1 hypothetical protein GCM10017588_13680 [Microbispora rosea subsp. aerata]